jgi:hypothetical protein
LWDGCRFTELHRNSRHKNGHRFSEQSLLKENENFSLRMGFLSNALYLQAEWILHAEEEKHG